MANRTAGLKGPHFWDVVAEVIYLKLEKSMQMVIT